MTTQRLLCYLLVAACIAGVVSAGEPGSDTLPSDGLDDRGLSLEPREAVGRTTAAEVAQPTANTGLQFGYDNGFFLASPDGVKAGNRNVPFLLRINARLQMRHTAFASNGPTRDENNFEFERAFLIFSGHVYTPDLLYHIKLDADSDEMEGLDLLDWFWTYDLGHAVWEAEPGRFGLKAGKWKMPFHRARQEASHQFQFTDRTMASEFFDINRSIGVGMFGRWDALCRPVHWEAAAFNGFQTQRFTPFRSGELDDNIAYAARVYSDVVGEWGLDGEPDLSWHESPAVRVGGAFAFSRVDRDVASNPLRSEFLTPRVCDSGQVLADLLPSTVRGFNESLYSVDANFKYRGMTVLSEYYFRLLSGFWGAPVEDLFDHGFMLQAGYFVLRERLELLARWSRVVGNSGTLGGEDQSADEVAGGIAWYIRGHDLKTVFDVTHFNGVTVLSSPANIRPGDDGWLFRTQLQILF